MNSKLPSLLFAGLAGVALVGLFTTTSHGQCDTSVSETVAYQPVAYTAYQPVAATGTQSRWYPGRLFDRLRLQRWGFADSASVAPVYTTAYSPNYYTASYRAAYRPYVTAYVPLVRTTVARPVFQTSFSPVIGSPYSTYATTTLYRPATVTLRPIATSCCADGGYASGVGQAVYAQPASGDSSCASTSSGPIYSGSSSAGPATPQPQLAPSQPTPAESTFRANRPATPTESSKVETGNGSGNDRVYPSPKPEAEASDSSTSLEPPQLYNPDDRTTNRPSVEVWTAVYHKPVISTAISNRLPKQRTQAEIDADGWQPISRNR